MDEIINVVPEGTTPNEQQPAVEVKNEVEPAPQGSEEIETDAATNSQQDDIGNEPDSPEKEPVPTFSVRFNHETKELTEEEAIKYAQKGFKYDSLKPLLDNLTYLSAINGKSEAELLESLIADHEEAYKSALVERYGDDTEVINTMMEKYKNANKSKLDSVIAAKKTAEEQTETSFNEKVANDFEEFKKDFPEFKELKDLPKDVLKSVYGGKDILTAYLHYKHNEDKKVALATKTEKSNSESTVGSIKSTPEQKSSVWDAAFSGLNS